MRRKWVIALYSFFIITYSFFLFSCKKKDNPPVPPSSYDYFPTQVGHWVIYDVDSIVHLDNDGKTDNNVDTFHFQLKELISSTFTDGEGRASQRIERYHRANDSAEWYITDVWTSTLTSMRAERTEDNIKYIPLAFPITASITWNGNAFNSLGEQDYIYDSDSLHVPLIINAIAMDSTLKVVREDDENFVENIISTEKYAVHIGRVDKVYQNLLKYGGRVVSGLDYHETLNSYGN